MSKLCMVAQDETSQNIREFCVFPTPLFIKNALLENEGMSKQWVKCEV